MKIFIDSYNTKFMQNMRISHNHDIHIVSDNHKGQLYKLHQQQKISAYIFSLSGLNTETLQFINDYYNNIKIFIYHDIENIDLIDKIPQCIHLVHNETIKNNNIIYIPQLINNKIFNSSINTSKKNNDSIICFMDQLSNISIELKELLYPNTKLKIKLYNLLEPHPQNLGWVSEEDKFKLLTNNKFYLSLNELYNQEAVLCGCEVFTIDGLKQNKNINSHINMEYQTYTNFLTNILTQ